MSLVTCSGGHLISVLDMPELTLLCGTVQAVRKSRRAAAMAAAATTCSTTGTTADEGTSASTASASKCKEGQTLVKLGLLASTPTIRCVCVTSLCVTATHM